MHRFFFVSALFATLAISDALPAQTAPEPADARASELIPYLLDELADVRIALEGRATEAEGGWFKSGAEDYQEDLDQLLDHALDLIAPDVHARWTKQIEKIDEALVEAQTLRSELSLQLKGAQRSEGARMVDRLLGREHAPGTVEGLTERLAEADLAIGTLMAEREAAAGAFAYDLSAEHGIDLDPEQAKAVLFSVHGGLMVESAVIMRTLAATERQLGDVLESGMSAEAARRYLGAASITRLVHARMLARHLAAYEGKWLPHLATIRAATADLLSETRARAKGAELDSVRTTFERNAETQERILDVIDRYATMLRSRKTTTSAALGRATERAEAAVNTLRTLEAAAAVSGLMDESYAEFQSVSEIEVPELLVLEGEDLEQFLDISRQLSAGM